MIDKRVWKGMQRALSSAFVLCAVSIKLKNKTSQIFRHARRITYYENGTLSLASLLLQ